MNHKEELALYNKYKDESKQKVLLEKLSTNTEAVMFEEMKKFAIHDEASLKEFMNYAQLLLAAHRLQRNERQFQS